MRSPAQLEQFFFATLELAGEAERAAYLNEACLDPELRAQIQKLIEAHALAGEFLQSLLPNSIEDVGLAAVVPVAWADSPTTTF